MCSHSLFNSLGDHVADLGGGVAHFAGVLALHLGGDAQDCALDALAGVDEFLVTFLVAGFGEQHAHGTDGGDGVDYVAAGALGGAAPNGLVHRGPIGIDVAA